MASPLRRERNSVTDLKIHLVCVTKYRRAVFTGESLDLIEYPPKLSVSQIVNALKGVSSLWKSRI